MPDFHPEVPAHVLHQNHIQNGVRVQAGTNWDLSRSAVATPIQPLPDPVPVRLPETQNVEKPCVSSADAQRPITEVQFGLNSSQLSFSAQKKLGTLKKGQSVRLVGHADAYEASPTQVSQKRVAAVYDYLRKRGVPVSETSTFGDKAPKSTDANRPSENRRVEVFTEPGDKVRP